MEFDYNSQKEIYFFAEIRYLTTGKGGRKYGVISREQGQFHYDVG